MVLVLQNGNFNTFSHIFYSFVYLCKNHLDFAYLLPGVSLIFIENIFNSKVDSKLLTKVWKIPIISFDTGSLQVIYVDNNLALVCIHSYIHFLFILEEFQLLKYCLWTHMNHDCKQSCVTDLWGCLVTSSLFLTCGDDHKITFPCHLSTWSSDDDLPELDKVQLFPGLSWTRNV